jgi:hypothetical protein
MFYRIPDLNFVITDPRFRVKKIPDPNPQIFLNSKKKKLFLTSQKMIWDVLLDPESGSRFFSIPDPEVKKAPEPGSGSTTLVFLWVRFRIVSNPTLQIKGTILNKFCF